MNPQRPLKVLRLSSSKHTSRVSSMRRLLFHIFLPAVPHFPPRRSVLLRFPQFLHSDRVRIIILSREPSKRDIDRKVYAPHAGENAAIQPVRAVVCYFERQPGDRSSVRVSAHRHHAIFIRPRQRILRPGSAPGHGHLGQLPHARHAVVLPKLIPGHP
ncbi:eORF18 [Murid betaherpesvirus 8]|uniref:EORF18 n=1 Tax=Rat cytomegalovirus (isolate England) TaxID=1261657 RepID=K7XY68_RCMVE|nr:eORF18 [Murid betaherpesvirus 8]AFX83475.1 eORF18 [Murid betaherpesvirus 8]